MKHSESAWSLSFFILIFFNFLSCDSNKDLSDPKKIFDTYVETSFSVSLDSGPLEESKTWTGSGFVFDKQGLGLTCSHVVPDDKKFVIRMGGTGKKFYAQVIKRDTDNDLAIVKWENPESEISLDISDSYEPETGASFYMISTPFGMEESFDSGIIANRSRLGADIFAPNKAFVQLNRMVLSGSSGAAVFDGQGKVLGMARFQLSSDGSKRDGIGFAIQAPVLREFVKSIPIAGKTKEEIQRGIVEIPILTAHLIDKLRLKQKKGVLVSYTEPGSLTEKAGIKRYDLIVGVDENVVDNAEDFYVQMAKLPSSKAINLIIIRENRELKIKITPSL
ncbi:S1C family serine protease [Leptospira ilyithenensis]|uniref:S1C family serine protease n=1 Tax=Leptospira ilyithenensis TaxID=2484901 RepID=UPI0014383A83|nr:S1C family serine protease [Leptospira ilyithenensis]